MPRRSHQDAPGAIRGNHPRRFHVRAPTPQEAPAQASLSIIDEIEQFRQSELINQGWCVRLSVQTSLEIDFESSGEALADTIGR